MKETINFEYEKETKNTIMYLEDSDMPIIGKLYVQKNWFDENGLEHGCPLSVTIETE